MEQNRVKGVPRYEVSAAFLLGSSKLLDALPWGSLRGFGIEPEHFPKFPGYLVVAGPVDPQAVVLVENPHSFEAAVRAAGTDAVAWAVTFGYGLSMRSDEYGAQLIELLTNSKVAPNTVVRKGNPPGLTRLLAHPEIFFWGDLDPAGLAIFDRLRRHLPLLRISALYRPMLNALRAASTSHPLVVATGKEGQIQSRSDDPLIAALLRLCQTRGVDQEMVQEGQIAAFCRLPLTFDALSA